MDGDQREALLALARQARERGWWQSYASAIPEWFQVYLGLEAEASLDPRDTPPSSSPACCRPPSTAGRSCTPRPPRRARKNSTRRVTVRLTRQERLAADDPPEYWAVLNEAVIRRPVGGPAVMREQLGHLGELAALPHVNIQVLPFAAGEHPAMEGSFSTLGFPEPGDPGVVYMDSQAGSLYLEQPAEIDHYARMFSHLSAKALDPGESRRMIIQAAGDLAG